MADGSIIIDARIDSKGAEANLKALQAKAKSTAQQIAAVDKQLGKAQTKRSTLADSLEAAKDAVAQTEKAIQDLNKKMAAGKQYDELQSLNKALTATLSQQDAKVERLTADYQALLAARDKINNDNDTRKRFDGGLTKTQAAAFEQERAVYSEKAGAIYKAKIEAAKTVANETAAELEKVAAQMDGLRSQGYGSSDAGDTKTLADLTAQLEAQQTRATAIEQKYQQQTAAVEGLQQQHTTLTAQLEQENNAVSQQADNIAQAALEKEQALEQEAQAAAQAAQEQEKADADADRVRQAAAAVGDFAARIAKAVAQANVLKKVLGTAGAIGQKVFSAVGSRVQAIRSRLDQAAKSAAQFRNRLMSLVTGALVFNVLSSGLRTLTNWMGTALLSSSSLRAALGNLQGAAATAAAPLLSVLVPALTALANAAAMVFSYIARLVAFFTGKTISASAGAAKAMSGVGKAAGGAAKKVKDANGELAAFDELNVLNKKSDDDSGGSGGGGGSAGDIVPDYDFTADNPFLDSILDAVEQGDWYKVGQLIGAKLRDSLNAIPWPDIQDKAVQWATNLATMLNGVVETPGLWEAIGHTLAQGLNTALMTYDTFMQTFHWNSLGAGLAAGLTQAIAEIQWDTLGRTLTDGLRAVILTLYNFTMTFSGWNDLGNGIATCLNAAINNIPWQEAAVGMSKLGVGLLNAAITAVQGTDWTTLGQNVVEMIGSIDWVGLFAALSTLAVEVLTAINEILGQVNWDDVGQRVVECLQAVDWGGILTQVGALIGNSWPVLLAVLGTSLLPMIGTFITGTVLPAVQGKLALLIASIVSTIGLWPALLIAALVVLAAAVIAYLVTHWDDIKQRVSALLTSVKEKVDQFGTNLKNLLANIGSGIKAGINAFCLVVRLAFSEFCERVSTLWSNFWKGLDLLFRMASAALRVAWDSCWLALSDTVSSIWDGITSTIRGAVNSIIGIINGMISAIVGGVNGMIGALNSISIDVPEFAQDALGTSKIGFSINPVTAPQIPLLAQGAVIPANHEFLAVLGDQTNGTNVEAPLATIQQALAEVLAAQGGLDITIRFGGDLAQLVRLLKPYIDEETTRRGTRLVTGGVY